jgi:signal transduction histidine kinase
MSDLKQGTLNSDMGNTAMAGVALKPGGDLPFRADDIQRIRDIMLRRLFILPTVLLLMVGGVGIHFFFAAAPAAPTDWLLALLAVAGAGVSLAGFWMAGDMAACLQQADMEARRLRTQLTRAGRMAELGARSSGIAHEINNPLQVMISELALMETIAEDLESVVPPYDAPKLTMLRESTEVIGQQIRRCSKITQGLVESSRVTESSLA